MPRDYKNAGKKKSGRPAYVSHILSFGSGLSVGLFVAFFVWLQQQGTALGGQDGASPEARAADTRSVAKAKRAPPAIPIPKFDFYKILPNREVNISEWIAEEKESGPRPEADQGLYVLQVGSFKAFDAADEVTATLALLGIDAEIQRVVINGQDVRHRVRIGPFSDPEKFDEVRRRLQENGLDYMVLSLKVEEAKPAPDS